MGKGQDPHGEEVGAPAFQRDDAAHACFPASHGTERARHGHDKTAEEENAVEDHQPFQPSVHRIVPMYGQPQKECGQRHHAIAQQVIAEHQSTSGIIQQPYSLVSHRVKPDSCHLREIHQQDQCGVDHRECHTRFCRDPVLRIAFTAESRRHHHIPDGQQHTHKIASKVKGDQHADGEQKN